jgi:hypothetical protein
MNGNESDPNVRDLKGIVDEYGNWAYKKSLQSGPTHFNKILQNANKICAENKKTGSKEYTIVLILTDGCIHDMNETKRELIIGSELP